MLDSAKVADADIMDGQVCRLYGSVDLPVENTIRCAQLQQTVDRKGLRRQPTHNCVY